MNTKDIQIASPAFSGSIPEHYERVLGPMFFEPYAMEVPNRLDPSAVGVALELASGTGRVTRHLRSALISVAGSAKEAAEGLAQGGSIYNEIVNRNPAWIDEIKMLVEKELSDKFGKAPMVAPMSVVLAQAWK